MESVVWLIVGIVLILTASVLMTVWSIKKTKDEVAIYAMIVCSLMVTGLGMLYSYRDSQPKFSKDYKIEISVYQKLIDNKVVSTDTIYKFIQK